jgi:predicted Zn-dependent protease
VALTRVSLASADENSTADLSEDYALAASHFENVHELGLASTPKVDFQLALVYAAMGQPADGERVMRRVIAREGEKDGLVTDLAELMLMQGRGYEAVAYLEDVVTRNPRFPAARWRLGSLYLGAGQIEDAVALYKEGVEARPGDYVAHVKLAEAQMAARRPRDAARALEGALALYPDAAGFRRDYAIALWMGGETERALTEMVRAAEDAEPAVQREFYLQASDMARQAGLGERATELARKAQESP